MGPGYRIRHARLDELPALPEIERRAAVRFACYGLVDVFSRIVTPLGLLLERSAVGRVWVAVDTDDRPVGFAVASTLDGYAHLDELDVLPEHGRRGIGAALIETVCEWARSSGFRAITLSTLSNIPWNAPFYGRLGFRILEAAELTPDQQRLLTFEAQSGLPMETRVLMRRTL